MGSDLGEFLQDLPTSTSETLRWLRRQCGLSQERFAAILTEISGHEINQPKYWYYENGQVEPRGYVVVAAFKACANREHYVGDGDLLQARVSRLQEEIDTLLGKRGLPLDWVLHLKPGENPPEEVRTILEASTEFNVSREALYNWGESHQLRGYFWQGTTHISVEHLRKLVKSKRTRIGPHPRREKLAETPAKS